MTKTTGKGLSCLHESKPLVSHKLLGIVNHDENTPQVDSLPIFSGVKGDDPKFLSTPGQTPSDPSFPASGRSVPVCSAPTAWHRLQLSMPFP